MQIEFIGDYGDGYRAVYLIQLLESIDNNLRELLERMSKAESEEA